MFRHIDADIACLMLAAALYLNIGASFRNGTLRDRRFLNCLLMLLVLLVADIGACMTLEAPVGRAVSLLAMTIYSASVVLTVIVLLHYLVELIYGASPETALRWRRMTVAPYFVYLAMLLANLQNGMQFSFTAAGTLVQGPLYMLPAVLYGTYTAIMLLIVLWNRKRIVSGKLCALMLLLPLLTAAGMWIQTVAVSSGWLTIAPFYGVGVFIAYLFIQESRTKRMIDRTEIIVKKLAIAAEIDELTGLYNRGASMRYIVDRLEHACERGCVLLLIDVDHFKQVNDTYGHVQGDHTLKAFAEVLRMHFRGSDIIGRLGGDEFIVFLPNRIDAEKLRSMLQSLLERTAEIATGDNVESHLTVSIGAVIDDMGEGNVMSLYTKADEALYFVKRNGRNGFALYDASFEMRMERLPAKTSNDTD